MIVMPVVDGAGDTLLVLPEPIHSIAVENAIDTDDGHILYQALRNQQAIEWIAMMKR